MRTTILILLMLINSAIQATTYYVSNAGNDSNSGLTTSISWQTLTKVNAVAFIAGDQILFKRGDTFTGTLAMWRSGSSLSKITFGAYGTGANPIISEFTTLTSWTNYSGNIYYATIDVSRLNIVTLDGVVKGMGRFPNAGYLNYESHNAKVSITDNQLNGTPNWTGAEIGIRKYRWIIDRHVVTNHTGNTLTYSSDQSNGNATMYEPLDGNGYFFQNHINCLDDLGDWCYNSSEKRIYMNFGGASPSGYVVKVGNADRNLTVNSQSFIFFTNIDFEGSNLNGVYLVGANNITFNACNFTSHGGNAVYGISSSYITVNGGTITDALNDGLFFENAVNNTTIDGLRVTNVGNLLGSSKSGDGSAEGIGISGNNTVVKNCIVTNSGFNAISFNGDNALIENNTVDTFCTIKDDGGGIYTYNGVGSIIRNNIILNAIGSYLGTEWSYWEPFGKAYGIYIDHDGINRAVTVTGNSIAHGKCGGIFLNSNSGNTITNNIVYDFAQQMLLVNYAVGDVRSSTITGNQFVAKNASQITLYLNANTNENASLMGVINNNYYLRPIDDKLTIQTTINSNTISNRTLAEWQFYSSQDANSKKSPQAITSESDLQFEYNATSTPKTITLSRAMIDVKGTKYTTIITLQPFTSIVLMKDYFTYGINKPFSSGIHEWKF